MICCVVDCLQCWASGLTLTLIDAAWSVVSAQCWTSGASGAGHAAGQRPKLLRVRPRRGELVSATGQSSGPLSAGFQARVRLIVGIGIGIGLDLESAYG